MADRVISTAVETGRLQTTLESYATGVAIVTATDEHGLIGFECRSFGPVSSHPPLISFSVAKASMTYARLRVSNRFAINVLAHNQDRLHEQFAQRGSDTWAGVGWQPSAGGNPVLMGSLVWIDCETWAEYDAGDHLIVVGRVVQLCPEDWSEAGPLVRFKNTCGRLSSSAR